MNGVDGSLSGVFYFTLSLVNAGLAQGKGRSGLAWWALSLLLGPIATLLIVLLPRLEPYDPDDL
ncbi:hypothetical protein [Planotetraspora mira]|uniref:Antitermination protein NusB n=1 Tax=Planotetraspora mira TaxID=58121 RepID=A0A8J3TLI1_9ACTN|nr:hypothetical protein [Planotetraspora mira]GII28314.1 hypothetical protein Pmi06nite_17560 [Planotetraspora mira]